MECYFDNSATTKPLPEVAEAMLPVLTTFYGNPSSLHKLGNDADVLLEKARKQLAKAMNCTPAELYFTGGGTESNNIAIFGATGALKRRGNRIVTTCLEHPSVEEPMKRLEEQGFEVVRLPVDAQGRVREEDLVQAVTKDTILVSLMYVNNEVGSVQPVQAARAAVDKAGAPAYIHCDAVQAFGKLPMNPKELGVDMISVSSHKIHGPKGVGALYVRKGVRLTPYILGGGQENGIRSGTQAMPAIVGFGTAAAAIGNPLKHLAAVRTLRDSLTERLTALGGVEFNSGPDALPFVLNLSLTGIPSEVLRNFLSSKEVYVSTGSACSKGHRSPVLTAMELPPERIDSAVRISFSRFNTMEEADFLYQCLAEAQQTLRKKS